MPQPVIISLGKVQNVVDFDKADFDKQVFTHGARVHWSRGLECPCRLNNETRTADPSCKVCGADGYFYVKPHNSYRVDKYNCEPVFADTDDAVATQVLIQSVTKDPQVFEKFGEWIFGTVRITPFSFARVDYRDRLTLVDSVTTFRQMVFIPAGGTIPFSARKKDPERRMRYKVLCVREAYIVDGETKADITELVKEDAAGGLTFDPSLTPETLVTVSYDYHPALIVLDHVYAWRDMLQHNKQPAPVGKNAYLPHHAMARLDFLVTP